MSTTITPAMTAASFARRLTPTNRPARRRRTWLRWFPTFLAFPPAGLAAVLVVDRIDGPVSALVGGAVAAAGIGAAQWWALRPWTPTTAWIAVTTAAMAVGLSAGAALVDYGTTATDLTIMGLVTGAVLGSAQAVTLVRQRIVGTSRAAVWAAAMPLLWALGWNVTRLAGIDVESQYAVFGAAGALTFTLTSGALLAHLLPPRR